MAGQRQGRGSPDEPAAGIATDIPEVIPAEAARTIVLRSLNQAARTRQQLSDLLAKRLVPQDVATEVLDRFVEVGLIDDLAYAENWVRSRHNVRGLTRKVLRQELRQRGIGDVDIEVALEQIDDDDEFNAAIELAARKVRTMSRYDDVVQRRKLMGILMRRGYSGAVATAAVEQCLSAEGAPESNWV